MSGRMHILLTGTPGVGKTTLIKSLISEMLQKQQDRHGLISVGGFYTEEVRQRGVRVGFDVVTIPDGQRAQLSRSNDFRSTSMSSLSGVQQQHRVGKYLVDLKSFESISLPTLALPTTSGNNKLIVMVIDEIGKMEMLSKPFEQAVKNIFARGDDCMVVATIPDTVRTAIPLVQSLVARNDTRVYKVTLENRDSLLQELNCLCCHALTVGSFT